MRVAVMILRRSLRQNWGRLLLTVVATAISVLMVLCLAAGMGGMWQRDNRSAWRMAPMSEAAQQPIAGVSPLLMATASSTNLNQWGEDPIWYTGVRPSGPGAVEIPGLPTPEPGQYYVSPAVQRLIQEHPEAGLGQRFGTTNLGLIPEQLLSSPDMLLVVVGLAPDAAQQQGGYGVSEPVAVYSFPTQGPAYSFILMVIIAVGALGLLVPALLFVSIATRFGSAQREQRYAAMRLVGATRAQVRTVLAAETLLATVGGLAVGCLAYLALRPLIAQVRLDGQRFFLSDVTISWMTCTVIALGTLGLALLSNWWGNRKVFISPLGVARRQHTESRPGWCRLIPLVLGLGLYIGLFSLGRAWVGHQRNEDWVGLGMIGGLLLVMGGMLLAGPTLTRLVARLVARRTGRARVLLASTRMAAIPRQSFRAVSAVVLALFMGSFYLTTVSGIHRYEQTTIASNGLAALHSDVVYVEHAGMSAALQHAITTTPGVKRMALSYDITTDARPSNVWVARCAEVVAFTSLPCQNMAGDQWVAASLWGNPAMALNGEIGSFTSSQAGPGVIALAPNQVDLTQMKGALIQVQDALTVERLRTLLADGPGSLTNSQTRLYYGADEQRPHLSPLIAEFSSMAYAAIAVTVLLASLSLLVSTLAGVLERRRALLTMRLSGMRVRDLQVVVLAESLLPLVVVAVLASAVGVAMGWMLISLVSQQLKPVLSGGNLAVVGLSLLAATAVMASMLPVIGSITSPSTNRTE